MCNGLKPSLSSQLFPRRAIGRLSRSRLFIGSPLRVSLGGCRRYPAVAAIQPVLPMTGSGLFICLFANLVFRAGSDLLRERWRDKIVVVHLHAEAATALCHGSQSHAVAQHL